ncbi:hypothetical protein HYH03_003189 [Edaphochlamys debaryana]|uniref:Endonuclease/exonuclease/phosphatase domain-containing protein n=1 Tax=Edaphochlamys debaryana TaxID=47281 RepID=A0A836C4K6_9CHLO|nr:hypothetical protein HYH03_003189 [Edaphochlamys debaryana]|eukprot:KAG2499003.1 hypothetical protein HYH03_003189 [Edaphochlamys debaryana]
MAGTSTTMATPSTAGTGTTLTLLTYNLNDHAVSDNSPADWSMGKQHAALRALILAEQPDLLCLQECFTFPNSLTEHYDFYGPTPSHRGDCWVATRKGGPVQADGPPTSAGPCVLLPVRLGSRRLVAACAHLAPFAGNGLKRARQVEAIVAAASRLAASPSLEEAQPGPEAGPGVGPEAVGALQAPLVLAGDMNMREDETSVAAENGLTDAWVELGCPKEHRFTWNTMINHYYYDGKQYTARYDRVLLGPGLAPVQMRLVGHTPCSEVTRHFLSDHFGLAVQLRLD